MQLGTHWPVELQTHSLVLPHWASLVGEGGFAAVQVAELPLELPLCVVLPLPPVVPETVLLPPVEPDDEDPRFRPVAVQMPPPASPSPLAKTQVPVQQSLSVAQLVPMPAVTLSGVQVVQSVEMSQPTGHVESQLPVLETVGEQASIDERIVARAPNSDRSATFMSHLLRKLRPAPYTKRVTSASHWSWIFLQLQASRRHG